MVWPSPFAENELNWSVNNCIAISLSCYREFSRSGCFARTEIRKNTQTKTQSGEPIFHCIFFIACLIHDYQFLEFLLNNKRELQAFNSFQVLNILHATHQSFWCFARSRSREIHKNTQNTAKFGRNLIKYMSVQQFWN